MSFSPSENYTSYYIILENGKRFDVVEGQDVTEALGIVKWSPPIPVHMAGEVCNLHGHTLHFDIENLKKYPDVFKQGEHVVVTEKVHGTWCCMGYDPSLKHEELLDGNVIVTSKGLSDKGLVFKFNERNFDNLYVRALTTTQDEDGHTAIDRAKLAIALGHIDFIDPDAPVYILGEVYGKGVQDLHYGAAAPQFRVFDVYVGKPGQGRYLNYIELITFADVIGVDRIPLLYSGEFNKEVILELTNGKETISGKEENIREGVVIKPAEEREDLELGRVVLKSVSEAYLLRKGDVTEFN